MLEQPEGPESAAIEAVRNEILELLKRKIDEGLPAQDAATAAIAAGTVIYGTMLGGIRKGAEEDAVQMFGTWIVDNIISMNEPGW